MKKTQRNQGITLIALVITIIVLLILAGISIATLTGENGVLTKASKAKNDTDVVETKELIKLELLNNFDEQNTSYTNQDVITAVEKVTGIKVAENTEKVRSKKGNDVDISDLWLKEKTITFWIGEDTYQVAEGTTWIQFLLESPCYNLVVKDLPGESKYASAVVYVDGTNIFMGYANGGIADALCSLSGVLVDGRTPIGDGEKYLIKSEVRLVGDKDPSKVIDYGFGIGE